MGPLHPDLHRPPARHVRPRARPAENRPGRRRGLALPVRLGHGRRAKDAPRARRFASCSTTSIDTDTRLFGICKPGRPERQGPGDPKLSLLHQAMSAAWSRPFASATGPGSVSPMPDTAKSHPGTPPGSDLAGLCDAPHHAHRPLSPTMHQLSLRCRVPGQGPVRRHRHRRGEHAASPVLGTNDRWGRGCRHGRRAGAVMSRRRIAVIGAQSPEEAV